MIINNILKINLSNEIINNNNNFVAQIKLIINSLIA